MMCIIAETSETKFYYIISIFQISESICGLYIVAQYDSKLMTLVRKEYHVNIQKRKFYFIDVTSKKRYGMYTFDVYHQQTHLTYSK